MVEFITSNWHEITIIALVCIAGVISELRERWTGKKHTLAGKVLIFLLVGVAIASLLKMHDSYNAEQILSELQTDLLRSQKELEKLIAGTLTEDTASEAKRQLALKQYEDAFASSSVEAEKWKSKFYGGLSEQEDEFRQARINDQEAAEQLSIEWYPMAKLIYDQYVTRAAAVAAEEGLDFKYEELPDPFTSQRYPNELVLAKVGNSISGFDFRFQPGFISGSEFRMCQIRVLDTKLYNGLFLQLQKDAFQMYPYRGSYQDALEQFYVKGNPLEDDSFVQTLNRYFNTVFEIWIIEFREKRAEQNSVGTAK